MPRPRYVVALFGLAPIAVAGCNTLLGSDVRDEPAVIIFHGDTTAIEAPSLTPTGTSFVVTVQTFGGGCTREVARTDVGTTVPGVVDIYPVNRTRMPREANEGCADDLLELRHSATVHASTPGPLVLRVHGVQRGGVTGSTTGAAVVERTVMVQ
ncbi:MAG TPA: hypothetical protein VFU06_14500 [Longimicrobiales bacterium]|nr:hypothetical protein [Longimicrobiales bacterium]